MKRYLTVVAIVLLSHAGAAIAQSTRAPSPGEQVLTAAAAKQKYTFVVFYRDNTQATQAMAQTVQRGVASRSDRAVAAYVNIADAAERPLVDRFDVGRAPMPLTVAVAPNGAITSFAPGKISDDEIGGAFVSPAAASCMKSMQEGKLVLACVQSTERPATPAGVYEFCQDPLFKNRTAVVYVHARDPAEADFVRKMELNPQGQGATIFMAPPGVLVGKFALTATKDQMAAALHKAGKCCDDENCKHNRAPQAR
jgi:hypothetical protein